MRKSFRVEPTTVEEAQQQLKKLQLQGQLFAKYGDQVTALRKDSAALDKELPSDFEYARMFDTNFLIWFQTE